MIDELAKLLGGAGQYDPSANIENRIVSAAKRPHNSDSRIIIQVGLGQRFSIMTQPIKPLDVNFF